jgi:hypothetical protein
LQKTLIVAAFIMVPHITFSGVLVLPKDTHPFLGWIFEIIFLKYANDGVLRAIYNDRGKLQCDEMYCHFRNPEKFLTMIDVPKDLMKSMVAFPLIFLVLHVITYYNVNKRLKSTNQ